MVSKLQLAGVLLVLGTGGIAAADIDASLTVVPGAGTEAPQIEALVRGGPKIPTSSIMLRDPRGVVVPGAELVEWKHGKRTIAIAIVFNGQEVWTGNDDIEPEDSPARYPGALHAIRRGIDALDLAHTVTPASQATLISYAERAEIRHPMGRAHTLSGAAVGGQKDYYAKIGTALVEGTALGISELENTVADRKLLLVISDGNDTNPDAAKEQLAQQRKRAVQGGIEVTSIIYKGYLSDPSNVVTTLAPGSFMVATHDGIVEQMREALRRATTEYTVRFPGHRLQFDGTVQDLTLMFDRRQIEPVAVQMGYAPPARSETAWYLRWWSQLAAGALLVGLIVLVQRLRGRTTI